MLRSLVFRWGCSSEGKDGSGKLGEQEPSEGLGAGERARRVPWGLEQPCEGSDPVRGTQGCVVPG